MWYRVLSFLRPSANRPDNTGNGRLYESPVIALIRYLFSPDNAIITVDEDAGDVTAAFQN